MVHSAPPCLGFFLLCVHPSKDSRGPLCYKEETFRKSRILAHHGIDRHGLTLLGLGLQGLCAE